MKLIMLLAILLVVPGCATGGMPCDGLKPIRPTKADVKVISDSLADQLLQYNEYGRRIGCWKR